MTSGKLFEFAENKKITIKSILTSAIEKHINKLREIGYEQLDTKKKNLLQEIDIFIKLTELDVYLLKLAGRYKLSMNLVSSQLAQRFITLLNITPTPTKGNEFSQLLLICFECADVIKQDADVYRYAKEGIDNVNINNRDTYKLLTYKEKKIVKAKDSSELRKKRILKMSRNLKKQ